MYTPRCKSPWGGLRNQSFALGARAERPGEGGQPKGGAGTILIYDKGGDTFDVSILPTDDGIFEQLVDLQLVGFLRSSVSADCALDETAIVMLSALNWMYHRGAPCSANSGSTSNIRVTNDVSAT